MSLYKKLLSSSILSVLDQGLLSAMNFFIGILLMKLVSKEDYGLYGQLYAGALLVGLVVDSWIAGPLTTVASTVSDMARQRLLKIYWYKQVFWTALLAALCFLIVRYVPAATHFYTTSIALAASFAIYVFGNGVREYGRTIGFIQNDLPSILKQDFLYAVLTGLGLITLHHFHQIDLSSLFTLVALASLLASLYGHHLLQHHTAGDTTQENASINTIDAEHEITIRDHGRWAVLGVIVGWLTNYSYIYLSGIFLGVAAIADLNAARLLLMPIPLAVAAWIRVARPITARLMQQADWKGVKWVTWLSISGAELMICLYVGGLLLGLPWLEQHFLDAKYASLDPLIILWGIYFAVNSARTIGTSWLMSGGGFRALFFLGTTTLMMVYAITSYSLPRWGQQGALVALIAVELFELITVWYYILPRLYRTQATPAAK